MAVQFDNSSILEAEKYGQTASWIRRTQQLAPEAERTAQLIHSNTANSILRPFDINPDRVVTFKRISASSTSTDDLSWHSFLSQIFQKGTTKTALSTAQRIIGNTNFSDLVVPSDVKLTFETFPKLGNKVSLAKPIQGLLNSSPTIANAILAVNAVSTVANTAAGEIKGETTNSASMFAPYLLNIPAYNQDNPTPMAWSSTFSFALGQYGLWNARKEVALPALNLLAPVLLRYLTPMTQQGPFPTVFDLMAKLLASVIHNITNGDAKNTLSDAWHSTAFGGGEGAGSGNILTNGLEATNTMLEALATVLEEMVLDAYDGYIYDISYGHWMSFHNVLITGGDLTFPTNEVDNYGYPVAANVILNFETIAPASLSSSSNNSMAVRFGV